MPVQTASSILRAVRRASIHPASAALIAALSTSMTAHAGGLIVQPVGVSTTASQIRPITNTIDQSGLSANYTSGVTDFDSFVGSTGHSNTGPAKWLSNLAFPKLVTLDLGAPTDIDGLMIWGAFGQSNPGDFDLYFDNDSNFGNGASFVGSYFGTGAQSFPATTTRYLHLDFINNQGGVDFNIGEFAVRQRADSDGDGVVDDEDNCPNHPNVQNLTQATVYGTITDALAAANAGDVLELGPCIFHEYLLTPVVDNLVIRGQGPDLTIIDADYQDLIYNGGAAGGITVEGITFREGLAFGSFGPAALYIESDHTFVDCHFVENNGGGAEFSTALIVAGPTLTLERCEFRDNFNGLTATIGVYETIELTQCVVHGGSDPDALFIGSNSTTTVTNCTFATGQTVLGVGGFVATIENSVFAFANPVSGPGSTSYRRCLFPGATGDNIDGMPIFEDAANDDYRLASGSPGIDAADADVYVIAGGGPVDFGGDPRVVDNSGIADTGSGILTYLDVGAFENQDAGGGPCEGDANGDQVVDVQDISYVIFRLGPCP